MSHPAGRVVGTSLGFRWAWTNMDMDVVSINVSHFAICINKSTLQKIVHGDFRALS